MENKGKLRRKLLLIIWLAALFSGISFLFWHNEYRYHLPTPIPVNYHTVEPGEYVDLNGVLKTINNKSVFLHFYNPDCPCSRFNIPHLISLIKKYGDKISFTIVVMSKENNFSEKEIQDKLGLDVPVSFDKSIANKCGVYSTPQAVILTNDHKLYYRGNYNKSRYCTDKKSNFAQMALDSLLQNNLNPTFNTIALKAYGCTLPNCNK